VSWSDELRAEAFRHAEAGLKSQIATLEKALATSRAEKEAIAHELGVLTASHKELRESLAASTAKATALALHSQQLEDGSKFQDSWVQDLIGKMAKATWENKGVNADLKQQIQDLNGQVEASLQVQTALQAQVSLLTQQQNKKQKLE
jgi:hypothetical protein